MATLHISCKGAVEKPSGLRHRFKGNLHRRHPRFGSQRWKESFVENKRDKTDQKIDANKKTKIRSIKTLR